MTDLSFINPDRVLFWMICQAISYDKNNKPIYEGDVLERQNTSYYYKVEYCEKNAAYICRDCDGDFVYLSDFEYIVIGNTYDKPPCEFDHNAECLVCDGWPSDCPFTKFKWK